MNASLSRLVPVAAVALTLAALAPSSFASAPPGRYTVANGTVYDTKTKLTWQQTVPTTSVSWGSSSTSGTAQYECATLSLNGTGWRLPAVSELATLVDYSQAGGSTAMIDATAFPSTPVGTYWTSTPLVGETSSAWNLSFANGATGTEEIWNGGYARCVR